MEYVDKLKFDQWLDNDSTAGEREVLRLEKIQEFYSHDLSYAERGTILYVIREIEDHELALIVQNSENNFSKLTKVRELRDVLWHRKILEAANNYIAYLEERLLQGEN